MRRITGRSLGTFFGDTYGWRGSIVVIEPVVRMVVSYVTNQMSEPGSGENRGLEIVMVAYHGLKALRA